MTNLGKYYYQLITFIVVCCLLTMPVYAQYFSGKGIVGMVTSQVSGDKLAGFNKVGISIGAGLRHEFNPRWNYNIAILYTQKGSRQNPRPQVGQYNFYLMRLHCAEIPITFTYKTKKNWMIDMGLAYARIVHASERDVNGIIPNGLPFRNNEWSITAGLSYQLSNAWQVQLLASNSISPIRTNGVVSGIYRGQYNSLLGLNMVYVFENKANE